jgi:hypothetical protein
MIPVPAARRVFTRFVVILTCVSLVLLFAGVAGLALVLGCVALVLGVISVARRPLAGDITAMLAAMLVVLVSIVTVAVSSLPVPTTGSTSVVTPSPVPARQVTTAEWNGIARDPDAHTGERVIVYGQVIQADANTGPNAVLITAGPQASEYSSYVLVTGDVTHLSQGDDLRAEIEIVGRIDYDTLLGGSNSAVQASLIG